MTTPTGDLRDQLREVLTREHYRRARERIEASPEEHCAAFADAVLPVVEAETARTEQRYKGVAEGLQVELRAAVKAQGEAERQRAEALEAVAAERRDKLAAQAAVRRVRALAEHPEIFVGDTFIAVADGQQVQLIRASDVLAALDAEQPKESP